MRASLNELGDPANQPASQPAGSVLIPFFSCSLRTSIFPTISLYLYLYFIIYLSLVSALHSRHCG